MFDVAAQRLRDNLRNERRCTMLKMRLKGCPRCGGDLMPDRSDASDGTYGCLQCGRDFAAAEIAHRNVVRLPVSMPVPTAA
jgi:hypothetical protein